METYVCVNMYHDTPTYMYPCHTPMSTSMHIAHVAQCAHACVRVMHVRIVLLMCVFSFLWKGGKATNTVRPGRIWIAFDPTDPAPHSKIGPCVIAYTLSTPGPLHRGPTKHTLLHSELELTCS